MEFDKHIQNMMMFSDKFTSERDYWLEQLSADTVMSGFEGYQGTYNNHEYKSRTEKVSLTLPNDVFIKLKAITNSSELGIYVFLVAAVQFVLYKYTNNEDIKIGTPILKTHRDVSNVNNILILKTNINKAATFREFLLSVRKIVSEANKNSNFPVNKVFERLGIKEDFEDVVKTIVLLSNLQDKNSIDNLRPITCFSFSLNEHEINCELEYDARELNKEMSYQILKHLINFLTLVINTPDIKLLELDILTQVERNLLLVEFNNTYSEYPKDKTLNELFEEQVSRTPDMTAVVFEDECLTYGELNTRANKLAKVLREKGIRGGGIVGIMLDRSPLMIIGILGILKAGGGYLPIAPEYPVDRIGFMLEDSNCNILLTQASLRDKVAFHGETLNLEDEFMYERDGDNLEKLNTSKDLAYIIYTSGSTGNPKGVMIEQCSVVNVLMDLEKKYPLLDTDTYLLKTSYNFDVSVTELFGWFIGAGKLAILSKGDEKNPTSIIKAIKKYEVTHINFTPSMLNVFVDNLEMDSEDIKSLKYVFSAGESITNELVSKYYRVINNAKLENIYGPTEITIYGTRHSIDKECKYKNKNIPIGKPLSNLKAYIVDKNLNLQPLGTIGELCISGAGLARGYLNNPELTNEKFVLNPFIKGEKMYKTGDLARWLPDGNIEFLGRRDNQVKIRGFRIELQEIESKLLAQRAVAVKEAVVIAKEETDGTKYLCGYLVTEGEMIVGKLREELSKSLPDYMIPSYFVQIDKLPLTGSGKIDKKALPMPQGNINTGAIYEAPRNEMEEKLTRLWQEVLGVEKIGINDNFFDLGGHSLKATILSSRIHKELDVQVPIGVIFKAFTIKKLCEFIEEGARSVFSSIQRVQAEAEDETETVENRLYEASSSQRRMYMLQQFRVNSVSYNMPSVMEIEGELNKEKLEKAVNKLIKRHETLRTSFEMLEGEIFQRITKTLEVKVEYIKAREAKEVEIAGIVRSFIRTFDLSTAPLLRVGLIELESKRHILMFDMHHIISDGTSMGILINEFSRLYLGEELMPLNIQYKDYSAWQNMLLKSEELKKQEEYWLEEFKSEIPVLNMPMDYQRSVEQSLEGNSLGFTLGREVTKKLKLISRETGSTMYMILLSVVNVLLSKYTSSEDIIVGSPVAGRNHVELEGIIGMFVNTLAMRNKPSGEKTYQEFLKEVKEKALKAYENQDYQFEELVDKLNLERDISRNPLFDVMFILQNTEMEDIALSGITMKPYKGESNVSKFDLTITAVEEEAEGKEEIYLDIEYCTKLFKRVTIERMIEHFKNIINIVTQDGKIKLRDIEILTEAEKYKLLKEFNDTFAEYEKEKTIHELFEEQVMNTPDNIAATFEDTKLTYKELNEKSNRLARTLRNKGVGPDSIIGIMMDRSLRMLVGIMGILKAGGAYLPIDPEYPQDRINYMLEDSKTRILITQKELIPLVKFDGEIFDLQEEYINEGNIENLDKINTSSDLAYVIYTSGSTGKPKGVMIEHKNLNNLIKFEFNKTDINFRAKVLQFTTISFDVAYQEIFSTLLMGGELQLINSELRKDVDKLLDLIAEKNIETVFFPTSYFRLLENNNEYLTKLTNSVKHIVVAGEQLIISEDLRKTLKEKDILLHNHYGPSETHVVSTYTIGGEEAKLELPPIGKPINNTTIYILNYKQKLLPIGVAGELYISGDCVGRGYLNNLDLTVSKFLENPFIPGKRMYKTGDLARWLTDGNLEFLGRIDHQVKIRGFRIELGEIESQLLNMEAVKEVVVVDRTEGNGAKYLCAYFVAENEVTLEELRGFLKSKLPDYMVPAFFIQLEKLPLTPNGKLDRKALPAPDGNINSAVEYVAPSNEIEKKLSKLWASVLGIENIGVNDNFFNLGGQSLKAIQLVSIIHREFNVQVDVGRVFINPSIKQLGAYIEKAKESIYSAIKPIGEKEAYKVSSAQGRLFALNQFNKDKTNYNMPFAMVIEGKLDKVRVQEVFLQLSKRHEAFRTFFEIENGEIVQRIHKSVELIVDCIDMYGALDETVRGIVKEFIKPFDLTNAPLFRVKLLGIEKEKHVLMMDMHHIVSDGETIRILIEEFTRLYAGEKLQELRIQYKDYSAWENELLESEVMKKYEKYWLKVFDGDIPSLGIATDYPRLVMQSFEGDSIEAYAGKALTEKLKRICEVNGTTLYMYLLAVYNVLLSKYSGQEDIIVGSPIAGRPHADLVNIVGMFVNILAMRNYPSFSKTFKEFLQEVKKNALEAYENQGYQFDKLVEKLELRRDLSRNALFDTVFVLQNKASLTMDIEDLKFTPYEFENSVSKFDLTLSGIEMGEELVLNLEYCTKLFKKETAESFLKHYLHILNILVEQPEIKLTEIELITEVEKKHIMEDFNATKKEFRGNKTIDELFEEQVQKTPDNFALVCEGAKLTYREVNEKADSLARRLRDIGVSTGSIVGILVGQSPLMLIGIMGIIKAGGAYLPIDPEYPKDRIEYMLEDSRAEVLLTQGYLIDKAEFKGAIINLEAEESYSKDKNSLRKTHSSSELAYVIYTSGSTGKPKGVMVEHRALINLCEWHNNFYCVTDKDRSTKYAGFGFDASVWEIFPYIICGATIHIIKEDIRLDVNKLNKYYETNGITISFMPTQLCEQFMDLDNSSLRMLLTGGDKLRSFRANNYKLINNYGPTENTVVTAAFEVNDNYSNIPIGKPISNTKIYIVNKNKELQPIGIAGELCIGGEGLARGYLNRPELTEEKFVQNPFEPGKRMYCTGDLARWLSDGNVEFLGRIDSQVKIRGYRIELGEIEAQLLKNEAIKEAVVIDREDPSGNKYLCAYIVGEGELEESELQGWLQKKLPSYMIPQYFFRLEKMPLTSNGKLNRRALPAPTGENITGVEYIAPRNETEKKLALAFRVVLGAEKISILDNFFNMGGHSIKAIQLVSIIHREFNVEVPVGEVFNSPTIGQLGEYIAKASESIYSAIELVEEREVYKVSSAQARLFALNQFNKEETNYNIPFVLLIEGELEEEKVEEAFIKLVKRHEAFRTSFEMANGEIVQRIHESVELKVEFLEVAAAGQEEIADIVRSFIKPFDLGKAPLLRVKVLKIAREKHILMVDMHHIVSDGATVGILMREFATIYQGVELPELRLQYKDYASWEGKLLASTAMKKCEEYWKSVFDKEVPTLNLPTDYHRPTVQSFKGESISFRADKALTKKVKALGSVNGATLFMTLLSAFNILLASYSEQEDIIVGSPIEGRPHGDFEGIVGMFVNTLAMRNYPSPFKTYKEFLLEVKKNSLNALENQIYQFDNLVETLALKRDLSRNPLFDTMFVLQNTDSKGLEGNKLKVTPYEFENKVSKFDLTLTAAETEEEIFFNLRYCTSLFKQETVERMSQHLLNILKVVGERPEIRLSEIELLSVAEKHKILEAFNDTFIEYNRNKTIQELFEQQAEKTPDNIAVVYEENRLAYRELNECSNSLARTLRENGVGKDSIVGLMLDRSILMIVGILGILKAGGAYLPIDPDYPSERINFILEDSKAKLLLTQENLLAKADFEGRILNLEDEDIYSQNVDNLENINSSEDLAYAIYTSGSTGNPKGVMIEHRSVTNLLLGLKEAIYKKYDRAVNIALLAPFVFDASVKQIFAALLMGHRLFIVPNYARLEGEKLLKYYRDNEIEISDATPMHLQMLGNIDFKEQPLKFLNRLIVGGDTLGVNIVNKFLNKLQGDKTHITNIYGPTECCVDTTFFEVDSERLDRLENIPIGQPLVNKKVYILGKDKKVLPIGVPGEIYVSGEGIARGYLNNPELTSEKFIENPFTTGERMYKTGDLARWLSDGNIEFLGRIDYQVKIRGFRIELGEIEKQLLKNEQIKEAVVIDFEDDEGNKYLCAYIVGTREMTLLELRSYLSRKLPSYMLPAYFMQIEKMPLTSNGKLDRKALPRPSGALNTGVEYVAPRNEKEELLSKLWSTVLGVENIGIDEDFFALGGHSLKAIQLASLIHKKFSIEVPLGEIFSNPTLRQLDEYIEQGAESIYASIKRVEEKELYKASSAQGRLFTLNQFGKGETNYNIPTIMLLEGSLNRERVEEAFKKLVERHEAFRTEFFMVEGEILQRIRSSVEFKVDYLEAREACKEAIGEIVKSFIKPFDLSKAPLLRVKLVELGEDRHLLMVDMHHIISDGVSRGILMREFAMLYKGEELKALKLQYKDYSAWENELLESAIMKKSEKYWLEVFTGEIPSLNLGTDYPRPIVQSFEGASIEALVDEALTKELRRLSRENGTTMFMTLLAAYNILLGRLSGQEDIIIGSPISGRPHADLVGIVGMFVNTLAMRNYPNPVKTFKEFLQEVKKNALGAYEHQGYQFDKLVEKLELKRDLSRNALFDTMFVLQNEDNLEMGMEELKFVPYEFENKVSKFDFTLSGAEIGGGLIFNLEYCTKLFKRETAQSILEHYLQILKAVATQPEIRLGEIELLSEEEKKRLLVDFNATKAKYNRNKTIYELFEEQVEKTPNNLALVCENQKFTYKELNERANSLARNLRKKGVGQSSIVGILVGQSPFMVIGVMGILKAGAAYLPIDPEYPKDRIEYMLEDCGAKLLLTQEYLMDKVVFEGLIIKLEDKKLYKDDNHNLVKVNSCKDIAYVIYTSGSTGKPKGVMVEHRALVNLCEWHNSFYGITEKDRSTKYAGFSFDASVWEIFPYIICGATLHIITEGTRLDINKLNKYYEANGITISFMSTQLCEQFMELENNSLRKLLTGGDKLRSFRQNNYELINNYGPTENTVVTTAFVVKDNSSNIPIGKPISNTKIYIVNKNRELQPIGVAGELCIGGESLARGYLNKPELTEEKFIQNPFEPVERMYCTGDLARWLPDGNIEFLGRIDNQVKIRGFRIELGEIEGQLLKNPAIKEAAVVDLSDIQGNKYLCAYIASDSEQNPQELREWLSRKLPNYMIPPYFMQLPKLPLNANGKIDRRALPEPAGALNLEVEYVAPRNEIEEKLAKIWSEVLLVEKIGIDDDFFALGGHSIKAIQAAALTHKKLKVEVPLSEMFSNPTIREIGEYIKRAKE